MITADQCLRPILPITRNLGSPVVRAGTSRSSESFQSCWAARKSMPCLARLESLHWASGPEARWARAYRTRTPLGAYSIPFRRSGASPNQKAPVLGTGCWVPVLSRLPAVHPHNDGPFSTPRTRARVGDCGGTPTPGAGLAAAATITPWPPAPLLPSSACARSSPNACA